MLNKSQFLMILHQAIEKLKVKKPIEGSDLCRVAARDIAVEYKIFMDDPKFLDIKDHPIVLALLNFALFPEYGLEHQIALERAWEYYVKKKSIEIPLTTQVGCGDLFDE